MNLASMTYADEYANIITKPGDFDANYDQWVADKLKMIQPVLDDKFFGRSPGVVAVSMSNQNVDWK